MKAVSNRHRTRSICLGMALTGLVLLTVGAVWLATIGYFVTIAAVFGLLVVTAKANNASFSARLNQKFSESAIAQRKLHRRMNSEIKSAKKWEHRARKSIDITVAAVQRSRNTYQ